MLLFSLKRHFHDEEWSSDMNQNKWSNCRKLDKRKINKFRRSEKEKKIFSSNL